MSSALASILVRRLVDFVSVELIGPVTKWRCELKHAGNFDSVRSAERLSPPHGLGTVDVRIVDDTPKGK